MTRQPILVIAAMAAIAIASELPAQRAIPIRSLGPVVAASVDSLRRPFIVRGLADGSVLVNEYARQRVVHLDPGLSRVTVAVDSGALPMPTTSLIPFDGDSSLLVDRGSLALLVLDEHGKTVRTIAPPKTSDLSFVALGESFGPPGVTSNGRLIYRGTFPPANLVGPMPYGPAVARALATEPDSAPLLSADFATRRLDTIGIVKVAVEARVSSVRRDDSGNLVATFAVTPYASGDRWMSFSDGSVAIVRVQDYHVDWIGADGTKRSTPKMPIDWRRLTTEEKQARMDSLRPNLERANAMMKTIPSWIQMPDGIRKLARLYDFAPVAEMPDYVPAFSTAARADPEGNLWILPQTSHGASGDGLLYDVVNRQGQIAERVRLPTGRTLLGFAGGGVALLMRVAGGEFGYVESARVR